MIRTLLGALVAVVVAAPAQAQDTTVAPTFAYADTPKEDAKDTGWKVEAKAGLLWLAGNSDSTSLSAGLKVTRDALWQRYSLTAAYAFAKSRVYSTPAAPTVIDNLDQLRSANLLSARLWNVTPRFDQWLVHREAAGDTSVYVLANIASDYAAGKKLFGGAQVGVSTRIFKTGGAQLHRRARLRLHLPPAERSQAGRDRRGVLHPFDPGCPGLRLGPLQGDQAHRRGRVPGQRQPGVRRARFRSTSTSSRHFRTIG